MVFIKGRGRDFCPALAERTAFLGRAACGAAMAVALLVAAVGRSQDEFGDASSQTLTGKAWTALGAGEFDKVALFTDKCRELYADEAEKQEAGLKDFLPAEKAHDAWALNDVGTCCFIQGQALEKQDRKADAAAAYKTLVESYGHAQCWDPKGWFWRPAEAAAQRLKQLDFDAVLDEK